MYYINKIDNKGTISEIEIDLGNDNILDYASVYYSNNGVPMLLGVSKLPLEKSKEKGKNKKTIFNGFFSIELKDVNKITTPTLYKYDNNTLEALAKPKDELYVVVDSVYQSADGQVAFFKFFSVAFYDKGVVSNIGGAGLTTYTISGVGFNSKGVSWSNSINNDDKLNLSMAVIGKGGNGYTLVSYNVEDGKEAIFNSVKINEAGTKVDEVAGDFSDLTTSNLSRKRFLSPAIDKNGNYYINWVNATVKGTKARVIKIEAN